MRNVTIQNGEMIYNKIKLGLSYIPGDLVIYEAYKIIIWNNN